MALEEAQRNNAEIKSIDDGSKKDDFIICDLQEVDSSGVPIIGKQLETRYVRIGQPPFDGNNQKKLTGLKQNDRVVIDVPINESGDLGRYKLTVKNVERQILPKIDNKLVKIVDPESKNLSDYKKRIKVRIDESYQKKADEIFEKVKFGKIKIKISREYKLEDAKQAHKDLEARKLVGPAILIP